MQKTLTSTGKIPLAENPSKPVKCHSGEQEQNHVRNSFGPSLGLPFPRTQVKAPSRGARAAPNPTRG